MIVIQWTILVRTKKSNLYSATTTTCQKRWNQFFNDNLWYIEFLYKKNNTNNRRKKKKKVIIHEAKNETKKSCTPISILFIFRTYLFIYINWSFLLPVFVLIFFVSYFYDLPLLTFSELLVLVVGFSTGISIVFQSILFIFFLYKRRFHFVVLYQWFICFVNFRSRKLHLASSIFRVHIGNTFIVLEAT